MQNVDITIGSANGNSYFPGKIDNVSMRKLYSNSGLGRELITDNNAITGISQGYEKILELSGVGFRAALKGNQLNLQLGLHTHTYDIDVHHLWELET